MHNLLSQSLNLKYNQILYYSNLNWIVSILGRHCFSVPPERSKTDNP